MNYSDVLFFLVLLSGIAMGSLSTLAVLKASEMKKNEGMRQERDEYVWGLISQAKENEK